MSTAIVNGMQKGLTDNLTTFIKAPASMRHFAVYNVECNYPNSFPVCGVYRGSFNAVVSDQELHEAYLPGFRSSVAVGAQGATCSLNALNGVPMCANSAMLEGILKKGWGFDGYVIADGGASAQWRR